MAPAMASMAPMAMGAVKAVATVSSDSVGATAPVGAVMEGGAVKAAMAMVLPEWRWPRAHKIRHRKESPLQNDARNPLAYHLKSLRCTWLS